MANLRADFDTHGAGLWRGGRFHIDGASIHGRSLTENHTGDLQVASNIDAGQHTYLHELWFGQSFGPVTVTVGLQDLNAGFMATAGAADFVNSSFGTPSVIALGTPVPIFPLTGLGAAARWDISPRWTVQAALFDGLQTDFAEGNPHNLRWALGRGDGALAMAEVHLDGRYKLGAHHHSRAGVWGLHLSIDQPLTDRAAMFVQGAWTPRRLVDNNSYVGLGATLTLTENGAAGVAIARAGLHKTTQRHETAIEMFYRHDITPGLSLQPDQQWILNPSGGPDPLPNVLVGILRLRVEF
jgi:porin